MKLSELKKEIDAFILANGDLEATVLDEEDGRLHPIIEVRPSRNQFDKMVAFFNRFLW